MGKKIALKTRDRAELLGEKETCGVQLSTDGGLKHCGDMDSE
jgi:hypothetical protein